MRSEMFVLPLLALARGVLASPCLPPLTSSLSGTTTASSETVSPASTESNTASATEPTTSSALSTTSTESSTVLTTTESATASASKTATTSATLSSASTESTESATAESTTTSALSTASTESTTTSAAQSTTTSAEPEPQETNLIVNGGFEASTPQPWGIFNTRNPGSLGISTDQFYVGQQSGTYEHSGNTLDEDWGIYQTIDNTRLELGGRYMVTIRIRVPDNSCSDITLAPSFGNGGWMTQGSSVINVGSAVNNWHEVRAMFRYNLQAMINNSPGVAIISRCESVSFLVDEVGMVKYVEPTTD
ncbi:hypothetical protein LCI18_013332 [Fusarium solani-melongenae]|uniref:Uncharacterized protein n=1 Tax=Fusarium solani subsp. cucurbitae TaxID=2747967 RepID=A0ACD3ZMS1_FUSSC|nr:hypothetical protein LCI18_013332 [Fusarium solani-melongenae]